MSSSTAAACPITESEATATAAAAANISTNAVTRNLSDLHAPTWFALLSANIAARTVVFHPIQLAISRKRVTRESTPPTVWGLMKAAYRGGTTSAYGSTCKTGRYDFGRGGIRGLYRGVGSALICNLVGETSYLFTLEGMKEYVDRTGNAKRPGAGSDAAMAAAASSSPLGEEEPSFAASSYSTAVGAMCGDLVSLLLLSPMGIVCNRQMTAGYSMAAGNTYANVPQTLRQVWGLYQTENAAPAAVVTRAVPVVAPLRVHPVKRVRRGFCGLYQGLTAGLLRIPSSGCWWGLYTKSKEAVYTVASPTLRRWEQQQQQESGSSVNNGAAAGAMTSFWRQNWCLSPTDNPLLNAAAGILASVITTLLFNPIAVIQTRQQSLPPHFWAEKAAAATSTAAAAAAHQRSWKTNLPFRRVYHVANDLVRKEGLRGFFKGAPANIAVSVMDGVIFTLLFEFTKLGSDVQLLEMRQAETVA